MSYKENTKVFLQNFDTALRILSEKNDLSLEDSNILFRIIPQPEESKVHTSTDDVARLWAYRTINFEETLFTKDEAIGILTVLSPSFPLWINLSVHTITEDRFIVVLKMSMRFRTPSQLHNQENGYPPFKIL